MTTAVILFEDHSAHQFRPLSWTVPVHEMGCGLFNLRERLGMLCDDRGYVAGLLPRGALQALQDLSVPTGWVAGPDAVLAEARKADRVLLINGRLSLRWDGLGSLLDDSSDRVQRDDAGLVLWSGSGERAASLISHWREWDGRVLESGSWFNCDNMMEAWTPQLTDPTPATGAWRHLWERVHDIGPSIVDDISEVIASGRSYKRWIFGVRPMAGATPPWRMDQVFHQFTPAAYPAVSRLGDQDLWVGQDVVIDPGVVLDARKGPIVCESGVHIEPNATLCGPLSLGAGTLVKSGAVIYGETAAGPVCKLSGEIAESQLAAYMNKQHAGFLGHAVIGSWVNLGADTTCSDLKNNYGEIKVNYGAGPIATNSRLLGLMMAEHGKTAIGTTFNTATTVGVSANVFSSGFPRTYIPNFAWGDGRGRHFQVERALETAQIVMSRRSIICSAAHADLLEKLAKGGDRYGTEQLAT